MISSVRETRQQVRFAERKQEKRIRRKVEQAEYERKLLKRRERRVAKAKLKQELKDSLKALEQEVPNND